MKILAINRILGQSVDITNNHLSIIPDSAIIREGKPFFVPGFSGKWEYQATIAYRVTRLGKNIAAKFAHRYIDALALAVYTKPIDFIDKVGQSAIASAFDGAFIIGDWIPLEQFDKDAAISIDFDGNNTSLSLSQLAIEDTIADISKYLTLKIGYIIAPAIIPITGDIAINTIVNGSINNTPNIKLKFK